MYWNTRVLEDLVYDRVRQHVDLVSLVELEHELADYVERALELGTAGSAEANSLSYQLLEDAWERLEADWRRIRDADCPLCAELNECSPSVT